MNQPACIQRAVLLGCRVPVDSPQRFLVDVQFSAGANYDPFSLDPLHPHVLPVLPRRPLHTSSLYQPGTYPKLQAPHDCRLFWQGAVQWSVVQLHRLHGVMAMPQRLPIAALPAVASVHVVQLWLQI